MHDKFLRRGNFGALAQGLHRGQALPLQVSMTLSEEQSLDRTGWLLVGPCGMGVDHHFPYYTSSLRSVGPQ